MALPAVFLALALQASADTGEVLYSSWCSSCHGANGTGQAKAMVRTEVPPADLADCATSTAEPEERWTKIITDGGASVGLSIDMPAFGEGATPEQLRALVRYIRSLCREPGWPPGELNLPRAFLVEKAYPENEVVLVNQGREQEAIYERRLGKRFQMEAAAHTTTEPGGVFQALSAALKYNLWHSLERRALATLGLEVTPAMGRQDVWEAEPYFAFGWNPGGVALVQGELLAALEEGQGLAAGELRLGVGRQVGRLVPMVEGGWTVPRGAGGAQQSFAFYPQLWVQLSRLGHVAASAGAELPVAGALPRPARLIAFILWDFGDAPLLRGW